MTNKQILEDMKRDLERVRRGIKNSIDPMMIARYKECEENLLISIEDLEGAIKMGADSPNGGLEGWY